MGGERKGSTEARHTIEEKKEEASQQGSPEGSGFKLHNQSTKRLGHAVIHHRLRADPLRHGLKPVSRFGSIMRAMQNQGMHLFHPRHVWVELNPSHVSFLLQSLKQHSRSPGVTIPWKRRLIQMEKPFLRFLQVLFQRNFPGKIADRSPDPKRNPFPSFPSYSHHGP